MKTIIRSLFTLIFGLCLSYQAQALSLTSLNIEWYGRGGVITGDQSHEYRDAFLEDFLRNKLPPSDIYIFQEITSPTKLMALFKSHQCFTYDSAAKFHQYILICARPELLEGMAVDYSVQLGNPGLRAAPIAQIKYQGGLLSVVGIHLKAGREELETRITQLYMLATGADLQQKVIAIGDFNTFEGDEAQMSSFLQQYNFVSRSPAHPTFLGRNPHTFDRAWSRDIEVKSINVYGPCNQENTPYPYNEYAHYQRFISDHCALRIEI